MPGPTTEVLNEDIKDVRDDINGVRVDVVAVKIGVQHVSEDVKEAKVDLREIRAEVAVMRPELQNLGLSFADHKGEVRVYLGLAKWAGAFLVTSILTSGVAGVWWASSLNSKLDERSKATDARLEKLEATINKLIEQGRTAQPAAKPEDGALKK